MESSEVLESAVLAGKILLESGAETYRVEETIQRIAISLGMDEAEAFVLPTGIMVSVCKDKKLSSKILRVRNRSTNLDKVDLINALSREIGTKQLSLDEINERLHSIGKMQTYPFLYRLTAAGIGAASFALLFKGDFFDVIASFLVGILIYTVKCYSDQIGINFFINTMISSFVGVISSLTIGVFITHADKIIISSLMLLVPGLIITNAIRDSVAQDLGAALSRFLETFLIAIAIALGATIALACFSFMGGIL